MWPCRSTLAGITVLPVRSTCAAPAGLRTCPRRPTCANCVFSITNAESSITLPSPVMSRAPSNTVPPVCARRPPEKLANKRKTSHVKTRIPPPPVGEDALRPAQAASLPLGSGLRHGRHHVHHAAQFLIHLAGQFLQIGPRHQGEQLLRVHRSDFD